MKALRWLLAAIRRHPIIWYLGGMYTLLAFAIVVGGGGHGWMGPGFAFLALSLPTALVGYLLPHSESADPIWFEAFSFVLPMLNALVLWGSFRVWARFWDRREP
jgi:hypothetical protein